MKIVVDLTRCQGYAQCAFAAPDVFAIQGDEPLLYGSDPDDAQREKIARAAAACPVQAIFLDRADAQNRYAEPGTHVPAPGPEEALKRTGRIVIVGASLAALVAVSTLRREGFTGSLTVIGDEPYLPYDRPPLSKQVLMGQVPARRTALPRRDEFDAHWRVGVAARRRPTALPREPRSARPPPPPRRDRRRQPRATPAPVTMHRTRQTTLRRTQTPAPHDERVLTAPHRP
ncbi:hypothetical protein DY245_09760 [Streptomyces inhibens]|uniref:Ferredoxin n=1 Tax=Streptomyces inhibens TaxID=2293571 RepID=A0A371Q735_STRIH|nr:hypothetical protein DY245_09760 [Streptomyces inhibens]